MHRLIQRDPVAHSMTKTRNFVTLEEAVWAARESDRDYVIERLSEGVHREPKIVKYRIGRVDLN